LYGVGDFGDHLDEFGRLCRGDPGKLQTAGFNSHVFHQVLKQREFASGVIITFQVMAFAGMSPGYPDAVCTFTQGSQKKLRIHPAGTGDSNDPYVRWIFHPSNTCQVGSTVATPVAQKGNDFRFPFGHGFYLL
jgi:hypothetical protein